MDLSLVIPLGIAGVGTALFSLWVFAIWKTGGVSNFFVFEIGETVPNGSAPCSLKEAATKKEFRQYQAGHETSPVAHCLRYHGATLRGIHLPTPH